MEVYRIVLAKYADRLIASGRAARWNGNNVKVIYTSSSQSLACLENVVHRSYLGLNQNFRLLTIHIPELLEIADISLKNLDKSWTSFEKLPYTQAIGNEWIKANETPILKVPSAIIGQEYNYLMNPNHPDFSKIELLANDAFIFDSRIKL